MQNLQINYDSAYAEIINLPTELKPKLRSQLTYIDSQIEYKNKYTRRYINPEICLLNNNKFYTGLLPRVDWLLRNNNYEVTYTKNINEVTPYPTELPQWLYDHQVEMIDAAIDYRRGILQSPTGSGKSIVMAYFIKHYPTANILITVPNRGLLKQTINTLQNVLEEEVGVVGDGKQQWGRVTVGIINTLSNLAAEDPLFFKQFDIYIADEVHRVGSNWYVPLCEAMTNNSYRIGLSATAWREKGDDKVLEGLIGPVILTIKEDYLIRENVLIQPYYYYIENKCPKYKYPGYNYKTGMYDLPNGVPNRNDVVNNCITNNKTRNNLIVDIVVDYLNSNPKLPILVLVEMIEHGELLTKLFKAKGLTVPFVYGKTSKKERESFIKDLKECKLKAGIASKILNEGVDIPSLGVGIIAGGGSNESKFIQQVGRFVRKHEDKSKAIIIDIHDDEEFYLNKNSSKRLKYFSRKYSTTPKKVTVDSLKELIDAHFKSI